MHLPTESGRSLASATVPPVLHPGSLVSRRRVLAGIGAGLALAACGGSGGTSAPAPTTSVGGFSLGARFADGYAAPSVLAAGLPQRAPYVLLDADGWPVPADGPDSLELVVRRAGSDGAVVATARVAKHGYVDDHGHHHATAYYPLVFTPPEPGDYRVDGVGLKAGHDLRVVDPDTLDLVQVGDPLPAVETPTGADHRGVEPICTQPAGMCPFHQVTVAEALGRPGPTALLVSTPRFCQQDVCGPTIDLLAAALEGRPGNWDAIHAEVYVAPDDADFSTTPVVAALGLTFEPTLVVADADGTITAAVHFTMDATEVAAALDTAG